MDTMSILIYRLINANGDQSDAFDYEKKQKKTFTLIKGSNE